MRVACDFVVFSRAVVSLAHLFDAPGILDYNALSFGRNSLRFVSCFGFNFPG